MNARAARRASNKRARASRHSHGHTLTREELQRQVERQQREIEKLSEQVTERYLPAYGLVLATNLWQYRLLDEGGRVRESVDLADDEPGFWRLARGFRAAQGSGVRFRTARYQPAGRSERAAAGGTAQAKRGDRTAAQGIGGWRKVCRPGYRVSQCCGARQ